MIFNHTIAGIPCQIEVQTYRPATPDRRWEPGDPREIEFDVLTLRGKHAKWLEAKLSDADRMALEDEIERRMEESRYD